MSALTGIMPLIWWAIAGLGILFLLLLILVISLFVRMKRFEKAYLSLKTFMSGHDLEKMLQDYAEKVYEQEKMLTQTRTRVEAVEVKLKAGVDRAEMVRYRAFENQGSDLSFALALLNQDGDGLVLNAIHTREECRIYAKPVSAGQSSITLSGEEKEVIARAMNGAKI